MIQAKKRNCKSCSIEIISTGNFCGNCIKNKQKIKEKKDKQKIRKQNTCTEKKLDTVFSKLVRTIYPMVCHSSGVEISFNNAHAAHFISRVNRCVRFDLRNVYPTLPSENMYNQLHVLGLAKSLKNYYEIDAEDWIAAAKQSTCKLTNLERKYMLNIFVEGLKQLETLNSEQALNDLRLQIIELTKKIM